MKRIDNLYEKIYDMDNLRLAHKHAKRGKGWYQEVQMVEVNTEFYLMVLQNMLIRKTYRTSEYETFTRIEGGKERLIYKLPYYPDRICQWAILQVIEPYLLRNLTADTYSALPGRGVHCGLKRLRNDIRKDEEGCKYCLKFDVKKYYPSIDHDILKAKYRRMFKDEDLLWLLDEIIDSTETGIPIGNYLSQYSANIYLSDFDHWIKEEKKVKHYHRYMDDIVILAGSKEYLHELRQDIVEYLRDIKLEMKSDYQIFPTYVRGVDFLGYRTFRNYTLVRKRTVKRMKQKISSMDEVGDSEYSSIQSYKGWLMHANAFRLTKKYITPVERRHNETDKHNL